MVGEEVCDHGEEEVCDHGGKKRYVIMVGEEVCDHGGRRGM